MQCYGVYIGMVVDQQDPNNSGRVKVVVPSLGMGETWAPVCTSATGRSVGGKAVIGFEGGSANHPIVLGFLR